MKTFLQIVLVLATGFVLTGCVSLGPEIESLYDNRRAMYYQDHWQANVRYRVHLENGGHFGPNEQAHNDWNNRRATDPNFRR